MWWNTFFRVWNIRWLVVLIRKQMAITSGKFSNWARIIRMDWTSLTKVKICQPFWQNSLKAGTHEGACSRSTLLQHAPGAKLPRLHQRFLAKKYVAQQKLLLRVLLPHIKLVWYEGASSRGKSVARFCFRSRLPRVSWNLLCWNVFQEQAPSCVLVGVLNRERVLGACLRSKLLRVYWLEYLPGSVFWERVSGASSLVCTGLYRLISKLVQTILQ